MSQGPEGEPEKAPDTVSEADLPKKLKDLYLRGESAMELRNWGYAISLFQAVLQQEPKFLDGRRRLRVAGVKANEGKKKLGAESVKAVVTYQKLAKKDPVAAIVGLEKDVLASDPHNPQGNQLLFDAAMAADMPLTAGFALETLVEGHPENDKFAHQLGQFYYDQEEFEKAAEVYEEIRKRNPADLIATKMGKDATAKESMRSQKWEGGSFEDLKHNKEEAKELEQQARTGRTKEMIEEYIANVLLPQYAEDQNNLNVVKDLADNYEQAEDFQNALTYYEWAFSLSKNDPGLERKLGEMREKVNQLYLDDLKTWIAENPTHPEVEEQKAKLAELMSSQSGQLISEAQARVDRNPTDMQLRFELGQRLFEAEEFRDAIPQLQQAKRSPNLRIRVMNMLGQCYAKLKMTDLAAQQFEEAVGEIHGMDETKKELLYNIGLLYDEMNEKEKSLDALKQIYAADYGYRDVAERVEKSYQDE